MTAPATPPEESLMGHLLELRARTLTSQTIKAQLGLAPKTPRRLRDDGTEWFKVVGVMEKRGELLGFSQDNYVVIPFDVGRAMTGNNTQPFMSKSRGR